MNDAPLFLIAVLAVNVVVSEWLVRRTFLRHFGTALLVILVTALTANLGVIPTGVRGVPLYDGVFTYLAPLGIFWLLLQVDLRRVWRAGPVLVGLFLAGAAGTTLGVLLGMWIIDGPATVGPLHHAVAGMFAGTYIGGSANFNAVALQYDVLSEGAVYTGAMAVDNVYTTLWMVASILLPRFLLRRAGGAEQRGAAPLDGVEEDTETVHPNDLALLVALGCASVFGSKALSAWLARAAGVEVQWVLILTTVALVLAQVERVRRLRGSRVLGMLSVYFFLAVIGAYCDVAELVRIGDLALTLFAFAGVVVLMHGLFVVGAGRLLRADPAVCAVASQANIGGGTSALALARSLGRADLVLPGVLLGSLGTGLGTYVGISVAEWLGP